VAMAKRKTNSGPKGKPAIRPPAQRPALVQGTPGVLHRPIHAVPPQGAAGLGPAPAGEAGEFVVPHAPRSHASCRWSFRPEGTAAGVRVCCRKAPRVTTDAAGRQSSVYPLVRDEWPACCDWEAARLDG